MNTRSLFAGILSLGLLASVSWACPGDDAKVKTVKDSAPCAKSAAKVVADVDVKAKKGGCGKSAATLVGNTAKKGGCSKSAKLTAGKKKGCCSKSKSTLVSDCPIGKKVTAVLASMPAMRYQVGSEKTDCADHAAKLAGEAKSIQYVIGDDVFSTKGEAVAKLASLLEQEASDLQSMQFVAGGKCHRCPMTAKSVAKASDDKVMYRVGGVDFESKAQAVAALASIKEAVGTVSMSYKVGDEKFNCSKSAGKKCKKSGAKLVYIVGDEETCCETTAKMKLAEAKIRTIVETAASKALSM